MGLDEVDELARRVVDLLVQRVSGRPNKRGGVWRLGLFSINWRHEFGKKTGASANGRRNGETLSQNTGATFGADRNGITAHLRSVASLDTASTPNGAIVDLDLHKSAAELPHLTATLRTFFRLGGFGVHYNVLDKDTLLDAKEHPERYPTLQVRLCGWNALFAKLSEKEQDEFISRAEH
jgi:formate C-acetyltransferase